MYQVLYAFKNKQNYLVEFKLTNLPPTALPSDVYHWVLKSETAGVEKIQKLHFVSMRSVEGREFREFKEGVLKFDDGEATFQSKDKDLKTYFAKIDYFIYEKEIFNIFKRALE